VSSVYFDTSAFVKLLVQEPGSTPAIEAWEAAEPVMSCRLLVVEARAALAMARRLGRISGVQHASARASLADHWLDVHVIEITEPLTDRAGEIAEGQAVRGFDALHLASALHAACDVLITADAEMLRGARSLGLRVIDARS
jgi:uncharacterized protein